MENFININDDTPGYVIIKKVIISDKR